MPDETDHHCLSSWEAFKHFVLDYSVPLLTGIVIALIFANAAWDDYEYVLGKHHAWFFEIDYSDRKLFDHEINILFIVNDIFMVFFFGLATTEVVEAFLPGGSLDPPTRALNPIMACIGGVVGPVSMFFALAGLFHSAGMFDSKHSYEDVSKGWGIPTATDIALAWMVAMQVFKLPNDKIHPAINYLLLMAVIDDAIGLIIIAVFYTDPDHPVKPIWLLLLLAGSGISYLLRRFKCRQWWLYVLLGGIPCWVSLLKAGVHPALTLIPVVPFMPDHIPEDDDPAPTTPSSKEKDESNPASSPSSVISQSCVQLEELSMDARHKFLKRVFEDLDIDHDGGLSKGEITRVMQRLGHEDEQELCHGEVDDLFKSIHGDVCGEISFDEFDRWFTCPLTPKRLPCSDPQQVERVMQLNDELVQEVKKEAIHAEQSHVRFLKLVFDGLDIDHEGGLSVKEIAKVMHKLGHTDDEMCHGEVEDLFLAIHGDLNGLISFQEFVHWSLCQEHHLADPNTCSERERRDSRFDVAFSVEVEQALEEEKDEVLRGIFTELDVDHEDGLTVKEITKVMHKLDPENDKDMAHEEVSHLFRTIHGDTEGKITFEEFRDWFNHKGPYRATAPEDDATLRDSDLCRDSKFESKFRHSIDDFIDKKTIKRRFRPRLGQMSWSGDDVHEVDHNKDGPLHGFAHACKVPVDVGLIMFSTCNAGAKVSEVGAMTATVLVSLVAGKVLGIMAFAKMAEWSGKADVPKGITTSDLWYVSLIASLGLTVALFVAGQAFTDESLEAQAKVGALLSGLVGFVAIGLRMVLGNPGSSSLEAGANTSNPGQVTYLGSDEDATKQEKSSTDATAPQKAPPTVDTCPHWKEKLGLEACPDTPIIKGSPPKTGPLSSLDAPSDVVIEEEPLEPPAIESTQL